MWKQHDNSSPPEFRQLTFLSKPHCLQAFVSQMDDYAKDGEPGEA